MTEMQTQREREREERPGPLYGEDRYILRGQGQAKTLLSMYSRQALHPKGYATFQNNAINWGPNVKHTPLIDAF